MREGLSEAIELASSKLSHHRVRNTERGRELTTSCPFHSDNRPSFGINLDTGNWNCFAGCGGGWIDTLLIKLGFDRTEVYALLKDAQKPSYKERNPRWAPPPTREKLLNEEVLALFEQCPTRMLEDGWDEEILWTFEVGYDMGQGRITFPIRDSRGRLLGISGRTPYPGVEPKYLIYRQEHLYEMAPLNYVPDRAGMLHNAHRALSLAHGEPLVIVEGFKEVMRLHQAGICGVCSMGTMFTWGQYKVVNHLFHATKAQIVVVMDNDRAGHEATPKICKKLTNCTLPLVGFTKDVKDIGELEDLDEVRRVIDEAVPYIQYLQEREQHGLS